MDPNTYEAVERIAFTALIFHFLGFCSAIKAIMESRTPQGAIAWAIGLVTFPYVSVPAYWVFGRSKFKGFRKLLREDHERTCDTMNRYIEGLRQRKLIIFPDRQEELPVEKLAKMPFTAHNQVELLINGKATFDSIFRGIERAKSYILVQFYIIKPDKLGNELKNSLITKAQQGVNVYFLYDEIGSIKLTADYLDDLRINGIQVHKFNTTKGRTNRFQLNFRNHRKIVVVDGDEAWVGGHNIGNEYLGESEGHAHWRDTHVKLVGPVAQSVQISFLEDWHWATENIIDLNWRPQAADGDNLAAAMVLPSGPEDIFETCTLFFIKAIQTARKRLWIASPYFVPDEQFITALHLAVIRGVDVRILIPQKTDNPLVTYTHWAYVKKLMDIGATVFWYQKGFMHQKVVLVDDDYATVGTANFDNRSFRLNFEITIVFSDRGVNKQIAQMLINDFSNSTLVKFEEIQKKSLLFRFIVRVAQLTSPLQ